MLILRSFLTLALMAGTGFAESAEPPKFYKLDFVVKEVEGGKVVNSRAYSILASTESSYSASIRAGSKVPLPASSASGSPVAYADVGTNIDCRSLREVQQHDLALNVSADIASTVREQGSNEPPVIRQNKWTSSVIVPLRKASLIFSSDDATTKRQLQLELTATPVP